MFATRTGRSNGSTGVVTISDNTAADAFHVRRAWM
jgi:hypothetical protein